MRCPKCKGLMVEDWASDSLLREYIWRCLNCGLMVDQGIARNQRIVVQYARSFLPDLDVPQRDRPVVRLLRRSRMRRDS
jgi:hypothetical protein